MQNKTTAIVSIRSFLVDGPMSDSELLQLVAGLITRPFSGFELSWGPSDIMRIDQKELDAVASILAKYEYNTLHCGSYEDRAFGLNVEMTEKFISLVNFLFKRGLIKSVTIHCNDIGDFDLPTYFEPELDCLAEVMGSYNNCCNTFTEIEEIIRKDKGWGLTLDVAHVAEMNQRGEPDLAQYLDIFFNHIGHVHLSSYTNAYKNYPGLEEFETQHSILSLCPEFRLYIEQFLHQLQSYPITLEGVVPKGAVFLDAFHADLDFISQSVAS